MEENVEILNQNDEGFDGQSIADEHAQEKLISVYVKIDENRNITDICSDVFNKNLEGYFKIDEGYGDRFAHAQTQYFDKPLVDEFGNFNYKI